MGSTGVRYVAFLRAISNVPMAPYRAKLDALGYRGVESHGATGNLLFTGAGADRATHEQRIARAFDAEAFVRSRPQVAKTAREHPHAEDDAAAVMFLAKPPTKAARDALAGLDLDGPPPLVRRDDVAFVWPVRRRGHRGVLDLEKALGVQGTMRTLRVVRAIDQRLRAS